MPTLVYSPGVRAFISTARHGLVDVTDDIVRGRVSRAIGEPSTWDLTLSNRGRKYDRVFSPNDRVTIFLKRLFWIQSMSGYLNSTPYFNAKPGEVKISGSCTLKYFQHFHWDPNTAASQALLGGVGGADLPGDVGAGPGYIERLKAIMTEVAGWDEKRIHIGNIPPKWQDFVQTVVEEVRSESEALNIQSGTVGGGSGPTGRYSLGSTHPDRNKPEYANNPSIGVFLSTSGKGSHFGGTDDQSTWGGTPALSPNEKAPYGWNDQYYLAFRIPTQNWGSGSNDQMRGGSKASNLSQSQYLEGRRWWSQRKILVTNPDNGNQFVGRVADIGPNVRTGKDIDMSKHALHDILGATTGSHLTWAFAADDAPLGKVVDVAQPGAAGASVSSSGRLSLPSPIPAGAAPTKGDFRWGGYSNGRIPDSALSTVNIPGRRALFHPIAAEAFRQMRDAAAKEGITLKPTGDRSTYRSYAEQVALAGPRAATPGTSNHGWGFAVDIYGISQYDFEGNRTYEWLQRNAARFGWVNPIWARDGRGLDEAWHWEFWGIFGVHQRAASRDSSGQTRYQVDIQPGQFNGFGGGRSNATPTLGGGGSPITPTGNVPAPGVLGPTGTGTENNGLYTGSGWVPTATQEDESALVGPLLYANDKPMLPHISQIVSSAGRQFSSAPNGDFIGWFPDYFNIHKYAAVFDLVPMEIEDFSIDWSDVRLKTHFFVSGAVGPGGTSGDFGGNISDPSTARLISKGVASLEYPGLLKVLLGTEDGEALADTATLLKRFGVRPERSQNDLILGPDAEYYIAVTKFMENWASQFNSSMPLSSFIPEIFPGMIARCDELNFQCYVTGVTHTFDYSGGFNTQLSITAPSRLDGKGLFGAALSASRDLAMVGAGSD